MITVKITDNSIKIEGHANYAPYGSDIVCAAVSAILQSAQLGIIHLAEQYPKNIEIVREIKTERKQYG